MSCKLVRRAVLALLMFLGMTAPGHGAAPQPGHLYYNGGPVISPEIKPLYWGTFTSDDIAATQAYLHALADYMSGANLPAGTEPTVRQYGVWGAVVDDYKVDPNVPSYAIYNDQILAEITNQGITYGPQTIVLVMAKGLNLGVNYGSGFCGYHQNAGVGKYFAYVPYPTGQLCGPTSGHSFTGTFQEYLSHEIFEASTDPHADAWYSTGFEGADPVGCFDGYYNASFGRVSGFVDNLSAFRNNGTVKCDFGSREQYAPVAAVSRGWGLLDAFYEGTDHALWHKRYNGSNWEAAHSLGGGIASAPAAVVLNADTMHVVAMGTDRNLYDWTWTTAGGWSSYSMVGDGSRSTFIGNPKALRTGLNRFDVVVQAVNAAFDQAYFDTNSWYYWYRGPAAGDNANATAPPVLAYEFGGPYTNAPVALFPNSKGSSRAAFGDYSTPPVYPYPDSLVATVSAGKTFSPFGAAGRDYLTVDAYQIETDNGFYRSLSTGWDSWSGATRLFPTLTFVGAPFAISTSITNSQAFIVGSDGLLYRIWSDDSSSTWNYQTIDAGGDYGTPAAVSWGNTRIDVFYKNTDGHLGHAWADNAINYGVEAFTDANVN